MERFLHFFYVLCGEWSIKRSTFHHKMNEKWEKIRFIELFSEWINSKKCLKRAEKWGTMDTSGRKWSEVEQSGIKSGRPL